MNMKHKVFNAWKIEIIQVLFECNFQHFQAYSNKFHIFCNKTNVLWETFWKFLPNCDPDEQKSIVNELNDLFSFSE